jgi:Holliday junction resolvase
MRRAAKRDANETEIIKALRQIGATVQPINAADTPDLLIGYQGINYLMEVKTEKGKLKPGQIDWHDNWRGQCAVVRSVDEAFMILGIM